MTPTDDVLAGQAVYNRFVLAQYDVVVLGLSSRLIWRCPKAVMLDNYRRHVGPRHLELGVGTAYFPDRVAFPVPDPQITLVDLNPQTLRVGGARLARYAPEAVQADVLAPLPVPSGGFDSAGMNFLLHCLPGDWARKGAALGGAALAVRPGGVVFGSTILAGGVPVGAPARALMGLYNRKGIFHNSGDDLDGLRAQLGKHFASHEVTVRGCVAVFAARTAA